MCKAQDCFEKSRKTASRRIKYTLSCTGKSPASELDRQKLTREDVDCCVTMANEQIKVSDRQCHRQNKGLDEQTRPNGV